jgi:hypothetical protein
MSSLELKMAAKRKAALAKESQRIAGQIEAKEMAAPDLKGRIKKWIQEEVEQVMARNDEKLMQSITAAVAAEVKAEVSNYCKTMLDDDYYSVLSSGEIGESEKYLP